MKWFLLTLFCAIMGSITTAVITYPSVQVALHTNNTADIIKFVVMAFIPITALFSFCYMLLTVFVMALLRPQEA